MESDKIKNHLLVDGKLQVCEALKAINGHDDEFELDIFALSLNIEGIDYLSNRNCDNMEYAIIDLQKQLPDNIQIACCQSCKHGNFCPYGDIENEIFCLFDFNPKDKMDVVEIFNYSEYMKSPEDGGCLRFPKKELLNYCEKYDKIDDDNYYTYNGWNYDVKVK